MVKRFAVQTAYKDWVDLNFRETKALRSYRAALHLQASRVGTPEPVACLERCVGNRLKESYFITVYQPVRVEFGEFLLHLLHHEARCSRLMPVLQQVAQLCRRMHDAGFQHKDLGNQNILLTEADGSAGDDPIIIDLNRGRIRGQLNLQQRGEDLSRLNIPSNLQLMFLDMYWGGPSPQTLLRAHRRHRFYFYLRVASRRLRHPFREARIARASRSIPAEQKMPAARDYWIWDDYSDQPLAALDRRERVRNYPFGRGLRMFRDAILAAPGVWQKYRHYKAGAFKEEVSLQGSIGIAISPTEATLEAELQLLAELGPIPVLVRVSHQDDEAQLAFQIDLIDRLWTKGHPVKLALLQDRRAIKNPDTWSQFVLSVLERVGNKLTSVELGHAINRVKWGVWSFGELSNFYRVLPEISQHYPDLPITGPATIDFEYPFLLTALKLWPAEVPRAALSHHLYVDRRGAPENLQQGFSAVEKFALARAIASQGGSEAVEVTEVNWPIQGTGIYSPVTPPFAYPEAARDTVFDSGVDESTAADYMIRYLVLALCSGLVNQVYWWRLVARGYGLVDLHDNSTLGRRPAFDAFRHFLLTLGSAQLIRAELPDIKQGKEGLHKFLFKCRNNETIGLCWAHGPALDFPKQIPCAEIQDREGNTLDTMPVELAGSPIYFRKVDCNKP